VGAGTGLGEGGIGEKEGVVGDLIAGEEVGAGGASDINVGGGAGTVEGVWTAGAGAGETGGGANENVGAVGGGVGTGVGAKVTFLSNQLDSFGSVETGAGAGENAFVNGA